jgi:hypothetical protein
MSKIKTREEIRDELKKIAKDSNLQGTAVDFLISITSTAYYNALLNTITINKESNSDTLANINSAITLAAERMYSVFRGYNPKISIRAQFTEYHIFRRGDEVCDMGDYKLFVLKDTIVSPNDYTEVPLIASTEYITYENNNIGLKYFSEFITEDISSDTIFYINDREIDTTVDFRTHLIEGIPFELTISDFGVRIYFTPETTTKLGRSYGENGFSIQNVGISGFKYVEDIDFTNLKESDFNLKVNYDSSSSFYINISDSLSPEGYIESQGLLRESRDQIIANFKTQINSIGVIRSNTDLLDIVKEGFKNRILDCSYEYPNGNATSIIYYYIPKVDSLLSQEEFQTFINSKISYFIFDSVVPKVANKKFITFNALIRTDNRENADKEIRLILSKLENKFNQNKRVTEVIAEILKITNVLELKEFSVTDSEGKELNSFTTDNKSYIIINPVLNYEFY